MNAIIGVVLAALIEVILKKTVRPVMNRAAGLARRITAGGCMEEITRLNEAIQDKQHEGLRQ